METMGSHGSFSFMLMLCLGTMTLVESHDPLYILTCIEAVCVGMPAITVDIHS